MTLRYQPPIIRTFEDAQYAIDQIAQRLADQADNYSTGDIKISAAATVPGGWLACDGSAVGRLAYAGLFSTLGTAFGAGDGATTFNLPDLRGRVPVGKGTNADCDVLGDSDGRAVASRTPRHTHNHAHTHTTPSVATGNEGFNQTIQSGTGATAPVYPHVHVVPAGTTGGASVTATDSDYPAYTTVNFVIKA